MGRVLLTARVPGDAAERLRATHELAHRDEDSPMPRVDLLEAVVGVDALVAMLVDRVDAELLDAAGPSLKVVANVAVGYDNIDVAAYPMTAGTPGLEGVYPAGNAPVVQRLIDAGAIIAGKANLHELAVGGTSQNIHFGHVVNPLAEG